MYMNLHYFYGESRIQGGFSLFQEACTDLLSCAVDYEETVPCAGLHQWGASLLSTFPGSEYEV